MKVSQIEQKAFAMFRSDFKYFIPLAFSTIKPNNIYINNWHIDAISEYLMGCYRGNISRLIINVPPRSGKSTIVSSAFPAWILGLDASMKFMCVSDSNEVGKDFARECRQIMRDSLFQKIFPECQLASDQQEKLMFATSVGGQRSFTTTNVVPRGKGFNYLILDDYLKEIKKGVEHTDKKRNIIEFFGRGDRDDSKNLVYIIVEQRLGMDDVTGYLINDQIWQPGTYEHLIIPALEYKKRIISFGKFNIERNIGDYMDSTMGLKNLVIEKTTSPNPLIQRQFQTQYQQNPSLDDGDKFRRDWLKLVDDEFINGLLANKNDIRIIMSCDTAMSEKASADYTAILIFALDIRKGCVYLLDVSRKQLAFNDLEQEITMMAIKYNPFVFLIEETAAGKPLKNRLENGLVMNINTGKPLLIPNIEGVNPTKDKIARSYDAIQMMSHGRFFVRKHALWRSVYDEELLQFPHGTHDDMVDATTMFCSFVDSELTGSISSLQIR